MAGTTRLELATSAVTVTGIGFTTTYKNAGTAKIPVRRTRHHELWVGLWVGDLPSPAARKISPFRTWTSVKPCTRLRYAAHGKHKLAQVSFFINKQPEAGATHFPYSKLVTI